MNDAKPKGNQVKIVSPNLDASRTIVDGILLAAASKFNLYDNSHTSRVPDTIKSIVEGNGFGFGIGARVAGGAIFVDFNSRAKDTSKYKEVRDFIFVELQKAFHVELQEIFEDNADFVRTR
jgi:hypothetical protein